MGNGTRGSGGPGGPGGRNGTKQEAKMWSHCYANCTNPVLGCNGDVDSKEVDDNTSGSGALAFCLGSLLSVWAALIL